MSKQDEELYAMRHSLAHIMATAIKELWPETKFGVGPVVENGFYYDVDAPVQISDEDFPKIEAKMVKIIEADQAFEKSDMKIDDALKWAKETKQPYKEELLNDLKREGTTSAKDIDAKELGLAGDGSGVDSVSFFTNGDFTDLCRGPHVESTAQVGSFKLLKVAGAYWRGDEKKPQMQRIYGAGFKNGEDLTRHLEMIEEARLRDHRRLGKEMDLFAFSDMIGSGLPVFTPKGTWLHKLLGDYSQQLREKFGFERVWSPHITKPELYKASGHWDKFGDELFQVASQETDDTFAMKPMNCPHHTRIYDSQPRSYKELPIKYMENTTDYRDEKSGELHGLSRLRAFTQDDCHVFCREDQIEQSATELVQAAQELYKTLDMDLRIELSFRDDSDAYLGDSKLWDKAQTQLEQVAKKNKLNYEIIDGEAAFYGPKIDFRVVDGLGRDWQVATVQIDFVQPSPERFNLQYIDEDGMKKTPVMIHSALLGSIERFLSVYIEHTGGHFPFWLAPEQVRILTVNDSVMSYVDDIEVVLKDTVLMKPLKYNEVRHSLDSRNESLGKKIREAEVAKVPVILIVGPRDVEAGQVSVRTKAGETKVKLDQLSDFLDSQ
ncbi:MAG: threonine--tRNA ligase [Candidatus Saccharimonadales bacterium]|nr:threonine--tRNA ligase [Candidatus Saccharimonadales bacterium]